MFSAILFANDRGNAAVVEQLAVESNQVSFQKVLYRFPQAFELAQTLNTHVPDLVFLDLTDWNSALAAANDIRMHSQHTAIIGFGGGWQAGKDAECDAAGFTELLAPPASLKKFEDSVERAIQKMRGAVLEN